MIDLSIIIVTWNVADYIVACLASIYRNINSRYEYEIIIVDSASQDNSVELIQSQYPDVKLMEKSENIGYTQGNNIGLEQAKGKYLILLNPDTEILDNALNKMIDYLETHPDVGMIGPHTYNTDGTTQSTRRKFPTKALAFFESTWLQQFAPKTMLDNFYLNDQPNDGIFPVDWVQGSALMLRREVFEQIGGLDTGYVMYFEELDWCKRASAENWKCIYLGSAEIIHHGGKSSEQVNIQKHIYFQESKLRYYRKFHGSFFATILRIFLLVNYLWQLILESIKRILGNQPQLREQRMHTYWRVLRSGLKVR